MPTFRLAQHRWTTQFFEEDLRQIPFLGHKRKVFEKFQEYTGLGGRNLKSAFSPGYVPLVKLESIAPLYGFTPPGGDEIWLSKTFVEELEAVLPSNKVPRGDPYAPSELETKLLQILEATVLHEMVHYCRRKGDETARLNYMSKQGRAYEEALADQFEKEAYGVIPTVKSLLLTKYMPKTAAENHSDAHSGHRD